MRVEIRCGYSRCRKLFVVELDPGTVEADVKCPNCENWNTWKRGE